MGGGTEGEGQEIREREMKRWFAVLAVLAVFAVFAVYQREVGMASGGRRRWCIRTVRGVLRWAGGDATAGLGVAEGLQRTAIFEMQSHGAQNGAGNDTGTVADRN
jgi:hypothetical protein